MKPFGWTLSQSDWCPYKKGLRHRERHQGGEHTGKRLCEDTVRRCPTESLAERPQKKLDLPTP